MFVAYLPQLGDAAPTLFAQPRLFGEQLNPEDTLLDWLGDSTKAVERRLVQSPAVDAELLAHLAKYQKAPKHGLESATFFTRRHTKSNPLLLDKSLGSTAKQLYSKTPAPQRVRISGHLEEIAYLKRSMALMTSESGKLHLLWGDHDPEQIRKLWGKSVLVEGMLQFHVSGRPQVLIAQAMREADTSDEIFRQLPSPALPGFSDSHRKQSGDNPLIALRGILDSPLTDNEFVELLEAYS